MDPNVWPGRVQMIGFFVFWIVVRVGGKYS